MSNLQLILDALDKYAEQTGVNLKDNPFAEHVSRCDSPDAVLQLLEENVKAFKEYRDKNRKFIDCLKPVVKFVHVFSGVLTEAAGLVSHDADLVLNSLLTPYQVPFRPAKLIFVGVNVLFAVCPFYIRFPLHL